MALWILQEKIDDAYLNPMRRQTTVEPFYRCKIGGFTWFFFNAGTPYG